MTLARHGRGPVATIRALGSQVHPVFMLPAVASSLAGGLLASSFDLGPWAIHATAIFCALYTAHVKDGYVDFHGRGEDDDHPLTVRGCHLALALSSVGFWLCVAVLWWRVDAWAALLTVPGWLIGYLHAPQLDTNPVTATLGFPAGIALAILGGHYVQATALPPLILGLAGVIFVAIAGIKVIDDSTDYDYDRSIDKRTVAVVLGRRRARTLAYALMATAMVAVVALAALLPTMPPSAVLATVAFGLVAFVARDADAELATMLLIRGAYVFLAILLATLWFQPFG